MENHPSQNWKWNSNIFVSFSRHFFLGIKSQYGEIFNKKNIVTMPWKTVKCCINFVNFRSCTDKWQANRTKPEPSFQL
jgi:hypothetical protein